MRGFCVLLMAAVAAVAMAGCGSDDDEKSSGTNSAALSRCNAFCDASAGKPCQLADLATCKQICGALMQAVSADCANKWKTSYDCQLAQPDICAPDQCQAQMEAANNCQ